jgi:hypothetical protein
MADEEPFVKQADYAVPLLRLLAELPDGQGTAKQMRRLFGERYGHLIPHAHRRRCSSGRIIWENNVYWGSWHLKRHGFLDSSFQGIWHITDAGRQWLTEHPTATHFESMPEGSMSRSHARPAKPGVLPGITPEMLDQTRKLMPPDHFHRVWGVLYDQLVAEERAKGVTEITQTELGRRTRRWLDDVHAFLTGENANSPSSETLCDWIHFCYNLELYREAAVLFSYIHQDEVDAVIYKRARRIADVSRTKFGG